MTNQLTRETITFASLKTLVDEGKSVYNLANENYFKNTLPYPAKADFKDVVEVCKCCGATKVIKPAKELMQKVLDEYRKEEGRIMTIFRDLLFYEHGVKGPKAVKAYELAWDRGHAYGFAEVASHFEEYADLIKIKD